MKDRQIVLYLARHGTTTLNASNCFRGKANPSLDEQGFRDANALGYYFSGIELGEIYASDKTRTQQTAQAIVNAREEKTDFHPLEELRALNVGDFSGKPKNKENTEAIEFYIHNKEILIPGGESLCDFKDRVRPIIGEAIDLYDECGIPCLLVVHSSIIHEVGDMFNDDHHSSRVEPGGVAAVYYDNGEFRAEPIYKPLNISKDKVDTIS